MTLQLETFALSKKVKETNMSDKHKRQPNTILTGQKRSTSNLQKNLCKTIVLFWVCPQGKLLIFHVSSTHTRQAGFFKALIHDQCYLRVLLTLCEINPKYRHSSYAQNLTDELISFVQPGKEFLTIVVVDRNAHEVALRDELRFWTCVAGIKHICDTILGHQILEQWKIHQHCQIYNLKNHIRQSPDQCLVL